MATIKPEQPIKSGKSYEIGRDATFPGPHEKIIGNPADVELTIKNWLASLPVDAWVELSGTLQASWQRIVKEVAIPAVEDFEEE